MTGPTTPGELLGWQLKKWRDRRKLSAQELAGRTAAIGAATLTRSAISKIEVAQRGVSVDEWLALAYALSVPPILLLIDLDDAPDVAVAPTVALHPWLAWEWIRGDRPPIAPDRTVLRVEEFHDSRRAISLYESQREASDQLHRIDYERTRARFARNDARLRQMDEDYVDALKRLSGVLSEMVENGLALPNQPEQWVRDMRELGILKHP